MQAVHPSLFSRIKEQLTNQPPLMWFSLLFLGGIVLGWLANLPLWVWIALAVVFIALALISNIFHLSS